MRRSAEFRHGCDDYGQSSESSRYIRRFRLRTAVLDPDDSADPWIRPPHRERAVVSGQVTDVSPHVIILQTATGEQRLTLAPQTRAWRGIRVRPAALREGDQVILRTARHPQAVERIWAQTGRVTGTIVESSGRELIVDEGPARGRQIVLIDDGSLRQIQVRFPRIAPGYLIDVIGLRRPGHLLALTPATAQPPYRADHPPTPPLVSGHVPEQVSGTAVWHEPGGERPDLSGVAYPALDPETSCEHHEEHAAQPGAGDPHPRDPHTGGPGCVRLPYLSVGSAVKIRNECTGITAVLPVTSCGAPSRLFCDRCVECGTSPRGRIADLTMTAFVELGGNLDDGCFNATLTVPA
ncbi:MAG: hypothetical protein J2P26_02000 [Nocardiopsaceae bacterium]|nr:hypothetical protein [Nocardiopsaceae bacterium]